VKFFELSGAAEAVVAKMPRPAAAKAPMMNDRIHYLLCFFPPMVNFTGGDVGSVMVNYAYANVCAESSTLVLIVARPMLCDKCRRRNIVSIKVEPEEARLSRRKPGGR
jgi:hypothetical protein